jgi:hypothetical protein
VLLADAPFNVAQRWFKVNWLPPQWLFWFLLAIAIALATLFTHRDLRHNKKIARLIIARKVKTISNIIDTLSNISTYHNSLVRNKPKRGIDKKQFIKVLKRTLPDTGFTVYPHNHSKSLVYNRNAVVRKNIKELGLGLSNPAAKDFNEKDIEFMGKILYATSEEPYSIYELIRNDSEASKSYYNDLSKSDRQIADFSSLLIKEVYKDRDISLGINNLYVLYDSCPNSLKRTFFIENRLRYAEFADCRDRYLTRLLRNIREKAETELRIEKAPSV